jgi:cytochrome c-type biogenesis protein CcmH
VCQNQSIDDSDAPLARDLRVLVRDRLKTGASDAEIRDYLVRRYGEFVLLKPVMGPHTALLWWGPPLLLLVAAFAVFRLRRRGPGAVPPLSPEEEQRLRALSGS